MTADERALGDRLEPAYDEHQIAEVWQRIEAARRPVRRRPLRWAMAGATALAVAILLVFATGSSTQPPDPLASRDPSLALTPGAIFEVAAPREVALDDGSRVALATDSRLEVLANEDGRFVTLLVRGRAAFDVRPGGRRQWSIETGLATVEVVGTAFTVEHRTDRLVVSVDRGVVIVRGELVPNRIARLTAGQHLDVRRAVTATTPAPSRQLEDAATIAPRAPTPPSATRPVGRRDPARVTVPPPPPASSRADVAPVARPGPAAPSFAELLADADRRRAAGDATGAAARLEAAIAERPSDPGVGVAAFMLGRLALDTLGQPARAARAFAIVIASGTPSGLREDAHVRRAEALIRAGDRGAAAAAIDLYERRYPAGRRGAELRARLDSTRVAP